MSTELPLKDVKIVDFTQAVVGPVTTRILADYGATVIKIETHTKLDNSRIAAPFKGDPSVDTSTYFANFNCSKYSISLNLRKPKAQELVLKLMSWADVVTENFANGVTKKLGLDYQSAVKHNPGIIYWANCQLGHTGPRADYRGFGHQAAAFSGMFELSGWPDRNPSPPYGAYTDFIAPGFAATAILAALDNRKKTGKGLYLDGSQYESAVQFLAPLVMDYWANNRINTRSGNRLSYACPHGVYRCAGDDRWIAIAVFNDGEWLNFCRAIGHSKWAANTKFSTLVSRKANEDELDNMIEKWSSTRNASRTEKLLQSAGVIAHVVQSAEDIFNDPQLKHRGHFQYLEHTVMGRYCADAPAGRLSKTPFHLKPSPCIGEHNEYVLKDILKLTDDDISDLLVDGVITTENDLVPFGLMV